MHITVGYADNEKQRLHQVHTAYPGVGYLGDVQ